MDILRNIEKKILNIANNNTNDVNSLKKDIKEYLKKEKNEIISSITHELKHKYDDYKKPKNSLTARGEYSAYTNRGFGDIDPINKFLHHLYFTHSIENLVRPSELAGSIQSGEISKKDFYNFLMDNRIYKELNISCQPIAINSGNTWPKHGQKKVNTILTVSILKPIEPGLSKEIFTKELENTIYSELDTLN